MAIPLLAPFLFALQGAAGAPECPVHQVVESRVRSILHLAPEQTLTETFVVERRASSLFVELRGEGSTIIGQRELPVEGSCDELAQAAAVVLSAWLTDVHPDFAGALPEPVTPPPAAEEPEPEPQPEPDPPPKAAPTEPPRIWREAEGAARPRAPSRPRGFQFGAAFALDLASGDLAAGAGLHVDYGFVDAGFGLSIFALATSTRSEPLGPGQVEWRRWPVGLGPRWRFGVDTLRFDASVGPAVSWLRLVGSGFDDNATQSGVSWGAFGSLRAFMKHRFSPFLGLNAQVYPGKSTAYVNVSGATPEWPLPLLSFSLLAGAQLAL